MPPVDPDVQDQALQACARALAGRVAQPHLENTPSTPSPPSELLTPSTPSAPPMPSAPANASLAQRRSLADRWAMQQRFGPGPTPASDPLGKLLHQVRLGVLGGRVYPGIGINLLAASRTQPVWCQALLRLTWHPDTAPPHAWDDGDGEAQRWQVRLSAGLEAHWLLLQRHLDDPTAFERGLQRLVPLLHRRLAAQGIDPRAPAPPTDPDLGAKPSLRADQDPPPLNPLAASKARDHADATDADGHGDPESLNAPDGQEPPDPRATQGDQVNPPDETDLEPAPNSPSSTRPPPGPRSDYRIARRDHDQVLDARQLLPAADLARLRAQLDASLAALPPIAQRLAARLQRRLQANRLQHWVFDQDKGLLDSARLATFIAAPQGGRLFKQAQDAPFRGAAVTLLVDNSGSMKGQRILLAALCTELIAKALERCGVAVEILGFTTRDQAPAITHHPHRALSPPGQDRAAKPTPGRLNATRHLVYKAATTPWRRARASLAAMLHEPLLKENIDGEALLWAHARLLRRPEAQRILLVISDGAPMDRATAAANGRDYLERHLFEVADWIERRSPVELVAIGIGHDVGRYYRRAVKIADPSQLAEALIEGLTALLLNPDASRRRHRL